MAAAPTNEPVLLYALEEGGPRRLPVPPGARSAHDALDGFPLGVYTGLRTFDHDRLLGLEAHLDRTDRCLELSGSSQRLDRASLRRDLARILREHPFDEAFVRIDVLSAEPREHPGVRTIVALSELSRIPAAFREGGVAVDVARNLSRTDPLIKRAEFVIERRPYPLNTREVFDHLLLDEEDRILECTSANFYVLLDGVVRTAGAGVLEGVTRGYCLRLCAELGQDVDLEPVRLADLARATEAFLSSSSRGIVPVTRAAGTVIGDGRPGPFTLGLVEAFDRLAEREARPAWPPAAPEAEDGGRSAEASRPAGATTRPSGPGDLP